MRGSGSQGRPRYLWASFVLALLVMMLWLVWRPLEPPGVSAERTEPVLPAETRRAQTAAERSRAPPPPPQPAEPAAEDVERVKIAIPTWGIHRLERTVRLAIELEPATFFPEAHEAPFPRGPLLTVVQASLDGEAVTSDELWEAAQAQGVDLYDPLSQGDPWAALLALQAAYDIEARGRRVEVANLRSALRSRFGEDVLDKGVAGLRDHPEAYAMWTKELPGRPIDAVLDPALDLAELHDQTMAGAYAAMYALHDPSDPERVADLALDLLATHQDPVLIDTALGVLGSLPNPPPFLQDDASLLEDLYERTSPEARVGLSIFALETYYNQREYDRASQWWERLGEVLDVCECEVGRPLPGPARACFLACDVHQRAGWQLQIVGAHEADDWRDMLRVVVLRCSQGNTSGLPWEGSYDGQWAWRPRGADATMLACVDDALGRVVHPDVAPVDVHLVPQPSLVDWIHGQ